MKDINKINDKNKIDLNSLSKFLIKKGDDTLNLLFMLNNFKEKDYSNKKLQDYYLTIFNYDMSTLPKELWNYYYFCEKAVYINPRALNYVPENLQNYTLCEKAVYQVGDTIRFVSKKLIDYALCEKAISKDGFNIEYIPKDIGNYYSLCKIAVYENGKALEFIPEELRDYPICKIAILNNPTIIEYVPKTVKNYYSLLKIAYENEEYFEKRNLVPIHNVKAFINNEYSTSINPKTFMHPK
jgi:hypothetical protein